MLPHSVGVWAEVLPAIEGQGHRRIQSSSSKVVTLATEMTRIVDTWVRSQVERQSRAGGGRAYIIYINKVIVIMSAIVDPLIVEGVLLQFIPPPLSISSSVVSV